MALPWRPNSLAGVAALAFAAPLGARPFLIRIYSRAPRGWLARGVAWCLKKAARSGLSAWRRRSRLRRIEGLLKGSGERKPLIRHGLLTMVDVAQLVEPRVVIPAVVGSSPIVHPTPTR
jgi:hypothetical protein